MKQTQATYSPAKSLYHFELNRNNCKIFLFEQSGMVQAQLVFYSWLFFSSYAKETHMAEFPVGGEWLLKAN